MPPRERVLSADRDSAQSPGERSRAETQLQELIGQIRALVPLVSPQALLTVASALQEAAASTSPEPDWLRPRRQLLFDSSEAAQGAAGAEHTTEVGADGSEQGGSAASLAAGASEAASQSSEPDEEPPLWMSGAGGVEGVGPLDTDDQLFSEAGTGRGGFDGLQGGTDAERAAYAEAQASGETASICSEEEAPRARQRGGGHSRESWRGSGAIRSVQRIGCVCRAASRRASVDCSLTHCVDATAISGCSVRKTVITPASARQRSRAGSVRVTLCKWTSVNLYVM